MPIVPWFRGSSDGLQFIYLCFLTCNSISHNATTNEVLLLCFLSSFAYSFFVILQRRNAFHANTYRTYTNIGDVILFVGVLFQQKL